MSLFRKASNIVKKFKIAAYGETGVGKTIFGLTFEEPIYIFDMERGADWYACREVVPGIKQATNFNVMNTVSLDEVTDGVREIFAGLKKDINFCKTVIIDPISVLWESCQNAYMKEKRKKFGPNYQMQMRDWAELKRPFNWVLMTLLSMPVHMVLLGRESQDLEFKSGELIVKGTKMQSEKNTPYLADIYMNMFTRPDPKTGIDRFFSKILKDRTGLLQKGKIIENSCYQSLCRLRDEAGISGESQEAPKYEDPEAAAEKDSALYREEGNAAPGVDESKLDQIIEDPEIKKLWHNFLDWAPGKVRAVAAKHGLNTRELLGKHLADIVRNEQTQGQS